MPAYSGNGLAGVMPQTFLEVNSQLYLWEGEAIAEGSMSRAVLVSRLDNSFYPWGLSFEVWFSGDPGAFEIDIVGANVDQAGHYNALGSITTVNNSFVGRFDMATNSWPRYVAAYLKTLTNNVEVTLQATR